MQPTQVPLGLQIGLLPPQSAFDRHWTQTPIVPTSLHEVQLPVLVHEAAPHAVWHVVLEHCALTQVAPLGQLTRAVVLENVCVHVAPDSQKTVQSFALLQSVLQIEPAAQSTTQSALVEQCTLHVAPGAQ